MSTHERMPMVWYDRSARTCSTRDFLSLGRKCAVRLARVAHKWPRRDEALSMLTSAAVVVDATVRGTPIVNALTQNDVHHPGAPHRQCGGGTALAEWRLRALDRD